MEDHMYRLISFFWRLLLGDPYDAAKHRTGTLVTNLEHRRGWRYKRPEHRWMSSTALLRQVRTRDLHTTTQPMRWWQHEEPPNVFYAAYHDPTLVQIRAEVAQIARWHQGDISGRIA
jgi:hypothetical protein